jgi:hypothetical protein
MLNRSILLVKLIHLSVKPVISDGKKKVNLSRYMPWRHMGGEEV